MSDIEIIFLGDIVGNRAQQLAVEYISKPQTIKKDHTQFFLANAENASQGFGLAESDYHYLIRGGFDCLTMGNHTWDKKDLLHCISRADRLVRPCNYPGDAPGKGYQIVEKQGIRLAVINCLGRVFMRDLVDCPFRKIDQILDELASQNVNLIAVDIHAETTSEKNAMAHYLDGRVDLLVGTHTHIPTADHRILPKGTSYVTDLGACMPMDSVIGMSVESILPRFLTGRQSRASLSSGAPKLQGVRAVFDDKYSAKSIDRI